MRVALSLILFTPLLGAQSRLWIVDSAGGPGVHFTDIPPAIAAANAGDRIEVRGSGPYSSFVLDKGVDLEAIQSALVPTFSIERIARAQTARVRGFLAHAVRDELDPRTGVTVRDCRGSVLLAQIQSVRQLDGIAMEVRASDSVLVVDALLKGGDGCIEFSSFAKPGLLIDGSLVTVQRARVLGGAGSAAHFEFFVPEPGADALRAANACVVVAESELVGGTGGFGRIDPPNVCVAGADGGAAANVGGDALFMAACGLTGGVGGGAPGSCPRGTRGAAVDASGRPARVTNDCAVTGTLINTNVIVGLPFLQSPIAAARGSVASFTVHGAPGQTVYLMLSGGHAHIASGAFDTPFLLDPLGLLPLRGVTVGAGGTTPFALNVPNLADLANQCVFLIGGSVSGGRIAFTNLGDLRIL